MSVWHSCFPKSNVRIHLCTHTHTHPTPKTHYTTFFWACHFFFLNPSTDTYRHTHSHVISFSGDSMALKDITIGQRAMPQKYHCLGRILNWWVLILDRRTGMFPVAPTLSPPHTGCQTGRQQCVQQSKLIHQYIITVMWKLNPPALHRVDFIANNVHYTLKCTINCWESSTGLLFH